VAVREQFAVYDVTSRSLRVQHVEAGQLIAKSGGGEDDPGRGFSDMPNVHFEVIESDHL
jgi:murein DD-endopeptidase MepM/ murein hydrolase activator NlpD